MLRHLVAAGEKEVGGSADNVTNGNNAPMDAVAAAEAAEMEAMVGDGDNELEGEGGQRRKGKKKVGTGDAEFDDDKLFDEEEDLEGEEDISDMSEAGDFEDDEDPDDEVWVPIDSLPYPQVWSTNGTALKPGSEGFNAYAAGPIAAAKLGTDDSPFVGLGLRLHQESVSFLLHPESPIERLLVDHATGTGKTLIMLRVLENYFDDPRPKVAIFPKDRVCDNFYQELLKWPTRWRDYFAASRPAEASLASGAANWKRKRSDVWDLNNERLRGEAKRRSVRLEKIVRELIDAVREALEMKNSIRSGQLKNGYAKRFRKEHPGVPVPRAPLRAFRYTTAGGGACELGSDGWPRSPILKVGFDKKELNPYSRKVIIMDECHNITRPNKKYEEQLGRLRDHLNGATGSVLAGFTGTPVGDQVEFTASISRREDTPDVGLELMACSPEDPALIINDVGRGGLVEEWNVQNPSAQVKCGDMLVAANYARGSAKRLLEVLEGSNDLKLAFQRQEGRLLLDVIKGQAATFCNDEGFVSSFHARGSSDFPREIPVAGVPDGVLHEGMFEDLVKRHSLHGEALKRYLLKEVEFQTVPRFMRMPEEKRMARLANYCNLHVHYGSCYGTNREMLLADMKGHAPKMHAIAKSIAKSKEKVVLLLAKEMGFKTMLEVLRKTGRKAGFRVATLDELSDFNDAKRNLRGERFRVMLAETSQAGEGIQFKNVRRVVLVDVPMRHSDLVQRTSRCVRLGGHAALPEAERTLAVELHVAQLPKFLRHGTGSLIYRELLNAKDVVQTPGAAIEAATMACLEELKTLNVKTLTDLQVHLQKDEGDKLIELLTETALEHLCGSSASPARPLSMALWRLRRGGDDLATLERALSKHVRTADEIILDWLVDKSAELLPPLEAMRMGAVDRQLLAKLGDPPRAPPPRSEAGQQKLDKAMRQLKPDVRESAPTEAKDNIDLDEEGEVMDQAELDELDELEAELMAEGEVEDEGVEDDEGMADEDDVGMAEEEDEEAGEGHDPGEGGGDGEDEED